MIADAWASIDGPTVLAAAASLQLDRRNVHAMLRLERLAALAARHPARTTNPLSTSQLKRLIALDAVSGDRIRRNEDEYEGDWVYEVRFPGGPYGLTTLLSITPIIYLMSSRRNFGSTPKYSDRAVIFGSGPNLRVYNAFESFLVGRVCGLPCRRFGDHGNQLGAGWRE